MERPKVALSLIHEPGAPNKSGAHHYSIRSKDYRYIRYNNGKEELYDHRNDPNEWNNLATVEVEVVELHRKILQDRIEDIGKNRNRLASQ